MAGSQEVIRTAPKYYFVLLLLVGILVAPVAAEVVPVPVLIDGNEQVTVEGSDLTIDCQRFGSDCVISDIFIYGLSPGGQVDFEISRPTGESFPGQIVYGSDGLTGSRLNLSLGSSTVSWSQFAPVKLGASFCVRYAKDPENSTQGLVLSDVPPWNQNQEKYAYLPVSGITSWPCTKIHLQTTGDDSVKLAVRYNHASAVGGNVGTYGENRDYTGNLLGFLGGIWDVLFQSLALFKFIFFDHFLTVVVLYESVLIAYAAHSSGNIVSFSKKFVSANEKLFTVIFRVIGFFVDFFFKIVQALKPI